MKMIQKLGVQLYTVRDYLMDPESADQCFAKLAELGFSEVQTAGCSFDKALFGELAKKHGLSIIGTHRDFGKILNEVEENIELLARIKALREGIEKNAE